MNKLATEYADKPAGLFFIVSEAVKNNPEITVVHYDNCAENEIGFMLVTEGSLQMRPIMIKRSLLSDNNFMLNATEMARVAKLLNLRVHGRDVMHKLFELNTRLEIVETEFFKGLAK